MNEANTQEMREIAARDKIALEKMKMLERERRAGLTGAVFGTASVSVNRPERLAEYKKHCEREY